MIPDTLRQMLSQGTLGQTSLIVGGSVEVWDGLSGEIRRALEVQSADYHCLDQDGGVAELRELLQRVNLRPYHSPISLLILTGLDRWRPELATTLLKTIEEPPAHLKVVMFAQSVEGVLPTIRSRAAHIMLPYLADSAQSEQMGIAFRDLVRQPLIDQLLASAAAAKEGSAQQYLRTWLSTADDSEDQAHLLQHLTAIGDTPVNARLALDTLVIQRAAQKEANVH